MGDSLSTHIQEDVEKYSGKHQIVSASIIDIMTVHHLSPDQMHANPDDDFANPKVGPNEEIVEKYIEEARRDMEMGAMSFDEPIMVSKLEDDEYMIVNGHHRWAAAIKVGLTQVRVVVVNPGMEDIAEFVQ